MATRQTDTDYQVDRELALGLSDVRLAGRLTIPRGAVGLVLFAHGSGSSRLSPRNLQVAERLHRSSLGTLLFDLLTPEESDHRNRVFDIVKLAQRLVSATRSIQDSPDVAGLALGYFGASTGAAAALVAAAHLRDRISAVVSRGGRPDLAAAVLPSVRAPTLLIVGGADTDILELNQRALVRLGGRRKLAVVPNAGHLFVEPGALDEVSDLAAEWFTTHLAAPAGRTR